MHWRRQGHGGHELRGIAVLREPVVPCRGGVAVWSQCVECARETWPWASGCGVSPIPKEERAGAVDRAMARDACAGARVSSDVQKHGRAAARAGALPRQRTAMKGPVLVPIPGEGKGQRGPARVRVPWRHSGIEACQVVPRATRVRACKHRGWRVCAGDDDKAATSVDVRQRPGHGFKIAAQGPVRQERRPQGRKTGAWACARPGQ